MDDSWARVVTRSADDTATRPDAHARSSTVQRSWHDRIDGAAGARSPIRSPADRMSERAGPRSPIRSSGYRPCPTGLEDRDAARARRAAAADRLQDRPGIE